MGSLSEEQLLLVSSNEGVAGGDNIQISILFALPLTHCVFVLIILIRGKSLLFAHFQWHFLCPLSHFLLLSDP